MSGDLFGNTGSAVESAARWLTAHCDGGSRGNPGPAGFGAVLEDADGRVVARLSEFLGVQTNNYAEYSGLLAVLRWALENGHPRLRVVSDSELMVNQMKGRYKVGSPVLRPLWEEARGMARRLERFEISHTLRGGNKEADRLANEAMDRGMGKGRERGNREQGNKGTREPDGGPVRAQRANAYERPPVAGSAGQPAAMPGGTGRVILDGYVKNGVVHLLEGELPEGVFVKVVKG